MTRTYGADPGRALLLLALAVACAAGGFVLAPLWAVAAVLALLAAQTWRYRAALVLTPDGFEYLDGLHRRTADWDEVAAVRVRAERHFLAFGRHLEVDLTDDTLLVLSSWQLGAPADEVAQGLQETLAEVSRSGRRPPSG